MAVFVSQNTVHVKASLAGTLATLGLLFLQENYTRALAIDLLPVLAGPGGSIVAKAKKANHPLFAIPSF